MRRQSLSLLPPLLVALAAPVFLGFQFQRAGAQPWHRIEVQGLTLEVPAEASAPVLKPGAPWTATEASTASSTPSGAPTGAASNPPCGATSPWPSGVSKPASPPSIPGGSRPCPPA